MMATSISEPAISPIRAVMLDYGEVLCFLPTPDAIARMARIFRIDPGAFLPIYTQSRGPYDRGDLSPEEYWRAFASQAGVTLDGDLLEELRRWDVEMWSRTNDPMIIWLESLHAAGLKTAILSNMPSDMVEHLRRNSPWMKNFDHQIFSAAVRRIKPEPAIYEHSLHALKVPASEILFVDDRDANLKQARADGMRGIRFQSTSFATTFMRLAFTYSRRGSILIIIYSGLSPGWASASESHCAQVDSK